MREEQNVYLIDYTYFNADAQVPPVDQKLPVNTKNGYHAKANQE